jgi:hypothetical protein
MITSYTRPVLNVRAKVRFLRLVLMKMAMLSKTFGKNVFTAKMELSVVFATTDLPVANSMVSATQRM